MKRTAISNMTPEQAMDELTFAEIKKLIQTARKKQTNARIAHDKVFEVLCDMCIDLDVPSEAENADILGDAISCYIDYGEYTLSGIMKEIKAQYTKEE